MARRKKESVIGAEEIKEMESKIREESLKKIQKVVEVKPCIISFDAWWSLRSKSIPAMHAKEIIMADFKSRGLSKETIEDFDAALVKYGVKL